MLLSSFRPLSLRPRLPRGRWAWTRRWRSPRSGRTITTGERDERTRMLERRGAPLPLVSQRGTSRASGQISGRACLWQSSRWNVVAIAEMLKSGRPGFPGEARYLVEDSEAGRGSGNTALLSAFCPSRRMYPTNLLCFSLSEFQKHVFYVCLFLSRSCGVLAVRPSSSIFVYTAACPTRSRSRSRSPLPPSFGSTTLFFCARFGRPTPT